MTDNVYIQVNPPMSLEGSSGAAIARYRESGASSTPDTVRYRIDCLTTGKKLADWTSLTPATSNVITITATHNAIQFQSNKFEKKQMTVEADAGTDNATRDTITWKVRNIRGF